MYCIVWAMYSVGNVQYGKCMVWAMCNVGNIWYGQCMVWAMYVYVHIWHFIQHVCKNLSKVHCTGLPTRFLNRWVLTIKENATWAELKE